MVETPLVFSLSVVTIAAGLLLLSGYLLLLQNMRVVLARHGAGLAVVAFLAPERGPSAEEREALASRLLELPGVEHARFVSREQALVRLRETLQQDAQVLEGLAENPLPASFELEVEASRRTPEAMRAFAAEVAAIPGIDDVRYGEGWVAGYARMLRALEWVGLAFGLCLALVLGVIVAGTVRLALHSRSDEIQIQRLVGASGLYVRVPLYVEAALQGALGAGLAVAALFLLFQVAQPLVREPLALLLGAQAPSFFGSAEVAALIVLGSVLGTGSAALSLIHLDEAQG